MNSLETVRGALEDGKGVDIKIIPTARQSGGLFSRMIIATANSPRHAFALASRVRKALKLAGVAPRRAEGTDEKSWILIDAGDTIIHIMRKETREEYDLENLWAFEEKTE